MLKLRRPFNLHKCCGKIDRWSGQDTTFARMFRTWPFWTFLTFCASACQTDLTGELLPNQAPETFSVVDTIIRSGDDRLESRVVIEWWGNDPDGYVEGYEYTFDNPVTDGTVWQFIRSQDSIFLLQTPAGQDTADFYFSIRAVDNEGLKDPTPAQVGYPVRNSAPTAQFTPGPDHPVLSFPIVKFFWLGSDPDGVDNLSHFELYLNDTTVSPYVVDKSATSATFEAENPRESGTTNCSVYLNTSEIAETASIPGMQVGEWNIVYIRAVDESEAKSSFIGSDSIFIRPAHTNILMANAYSGGSDAIFTLYHNQLSTLGLGNYDTLTLFDPTVPLQLAADNLTQERIFALFDLIVWFGNNAQTSLSLAQKTSGSFFAQGGKMLMSIYISSSFDQQSDFLDFTPIAELVDPVDTTLLLNSGAQLLPLEAGWPTLQGTSIIGVVRPLIAQIGADPIYEAQLTARDNTTLTLSPWTGPSVIMARKYDASGNPNFLLSTLEIHRLDGIGTLNAFFQKVLVEDFGF